MRPSGRFEMKPTQKQLFTQPECPVYIHCSRCCTEKRSGTNFVQVRMVNCSERMVCDVYLRIEGLDANGKTCFVYNEVVLAQCNALPQSVFGENRLNAIGQISAESLRITVERVCFADGMIWRRLPGHKLVDMTNWESCACGMNHPPKATACVLCGRMFSNMVTPTVQHEPVEAPTPMAMFVRPEPIVRPPISFPQLPPEEPETSNGRKIFFAILLIFAFLLLAGALAYAHHLNLF